MQVSDNILTNHNLDEKNISAHDAFEKFRAAFPLTRVSVMKIGMTYELAHGSRFTDNKIWLTRASEIIQLLQLPLKASFEKSIRSDYLFIQAN